VHALQADQLLLTQGQRKRLAESGTTMRAIRLGLRVHEPAVVGYPAQEVAAFRSVGRCCWIRPVAEDRRQLHGLAGGTDGRRGHGRFRGGSRCGFFRRNVFARSAGIGCCARQRGPSPSSAST
jgi:hypothetical protein